jgi:hypothetical protein
MYSPQGLDAVIRPFPGWCQSLIVSSPHPGTALPGSLGHLRTAPRADGSVTRPSGAQGELAAVLDCSHEPSVTGPSCSRSGTGPR